MDYHQLSIDIVAWFAEPEHYSVVHFAVENGMSKEELFKAAADSAEFKKALDYAFSVQEYKVVEGAISGTLDRASALKMLETYNGWKGDISILQNVSQSMSPELAERLSDAIERMDTIGAELDAEAPTDRFGEIDISDNGTESSNQFLDNDGTA